MPLVLRDGVPADSNAVHRIHAHAVETGTASFALEPPSADEIATRIARIVEQQLPFHIAELDGVVVGYAFADWFRPRPGYRFTLEDSIYIDPGHQGSGIGKQLLTQLVETASTRGYKQMIAVIGDIENTGSVALHKACGFQFCGVLKNVGFKFDRWLDSIYMQRSL